MASSAAVTWWPSADAEGSYQCRLLDYQIISLGIIQIMLFLISFPSPKFPWEKEARRSSDPPERVVYEKKRERERKNNDGRRRRR